MKVIPLHDWVVIRPSEPAEKTAGGLYIPDAAKDKPQEGVVEAIGPGALEEQQRKKSEKKDRRFIPTVVKPGDRVVYGRYAGQAYTIDGEERILVRERDILGILPAPLQIQAATASAGGTALMKPAATASLTRPKAAKKTAVKKTKKAVTKEAKGKAQATKTKKAAKKSAKKQAKKTSKASSKPVRKIKAKKAATRKAGK